MTYSLQISDTKKLLFSDSMFKPFRKKPTISIYDLETNTDTKLASFNNQEAFEQFVKEIRLLSVIADGQCRMRGSEHERDFIQR